MRDRRFIRLGAILAVLIAGGCTTLSPSQRTPILDTEPLWTHLPATLEADAGAAVPVGEAIALNTTPVRLAVRRTL